MGSNKKNRVSSRAQGREKPLEQQASITIPAARFCAAKRFGLRIAYRHHQMEEDADSSNFKIFFDAKFLNVPPRRIALYGFRLLMRIRV